MDTKIISGNVKIAEFMGWKKDPAYGWLSPTEKDHWDDEFRSDDYLQFNWSWDWLMPVWYKFRVLSAPTGLEGVLLNYITRLAQNLAYEEIGVFFKNLVTAIDWYNLNVTPPTNNK